MGSKYTLGLDFGTNSVRSLIVDVATGREVATSVWNYKHGEAGIIVDKSDPNLARQHPQDYVDGIYASITRSLKLAVKDKSFDPKAIIGIGVDTTGSTPIPVDRDGTPLAFKPEFKNNPNAYAWLWKDHTAFAEAEEITGLARKIRPQYLAKCGGTYSSEWYWAKVLHCLRVDKTVFNAAYTWVECVDWIPAILTGTIKPGEIKRGICAAGHKAMFHTAWGGYPEEVFLEKLDPGLVRVRKTLPDHAFSIKDAAGLLTKEWAGRLKLPEG
ncbi:MAG: FGGY family carbohydrate kinase, partial [Spirochaetota bacterium]